MLEGTAHLPLPALPGSLRAVNLAKCQNAVKTDTAADASRGGCAGRRQADGTKSAGSSTCLSLGTAPPPPSSLPGSLRDIKCVSIYIKRSL